MSSIFEAWCIDEFHISLYIYTHVAGGQVDPTSLQCQISTKLFVLDAVARVWWHWGWWWDWVSMGVGDLGWVFWVELFGPNLKGVFEPCQHFPQVVATMGLLQDMMGEKTKIYNW